MYETETVTTYPDFHRSPPPHPFNQTKKTHISKPQNKSYTFYSFFNPPGTLLMVGGVFLVMWTCRIWETVLPEGAPVHVTVTSKLLG